MRREEMYSHPALKQQLSRLLSAYNVSFDLDQKVLERIIGLLKMERFDAIHGLICSTEVTTYGGELSNARVNQIRQEIINWWTTSE